MSSLRTLLAGPAIVVAPGCYDALSALMIERAGFPAAYVSGASLAYTRFGRPDIGLIAMDEVVDAVGAIRERVALPLIVDCDTGFGNALNVMRTVKAMARAGASAIQLEDQTSPKRCGHLADKGLIDAREMVGKLKAALDARPSEDVLIIARTDAVAVEGYAAALDRAEAYAAAGADLLFVEAPRNDEELAGVARRFRGRVPVMANMVEGGKTPLKDAATLQALGFALVIFPGGTVRALAHALADYFASLQQHGTTAPFRNRMLDFAALNDLVGTPDMLALGRRYDPQPGSGGQS
ncbi:MAG TPA: isocitrate lyase/phosphoenolpyruvate mutase family protein [Xanthobacteraceae bacterium]|jgi:2-methylisocitrate lyase-like PEP mutase family enzyme|nr:isocitrate lyase/phosphoenolpyruvate mutase family protein [Xanthobacteraceae bacterium]